MRGLLVVNVAMSNQHCLKNYLKKKALNICGDNAIRGNYLAHVFVYKIY